MRPAVAVMPPNEIIFTSSKFEQMRQTQKTTLMIKKGREKERFIILVFYVVFKHTEDIYPLLFYTKSFRGAKIIQTKVKTNSSGIYLVSFVSTIYLYHNKTGLEDGWGAEILYGSDNLFKNWAICFPSMSP